MPNYAYHLALASGRLSRRIYRALLPVIVRERIPKGREIPIEVFSYSSEDSLPEQIASIRSFLRYAGRPNHFTVVSDGTHSERSIQLLKRLDPVVSVAELPQLPVDLPPRLSTYLRTHPTGKQLGLIMSLPWKGPALYTDSDVLFFAGAHDLVTLALAPNAPAFYLEDCEFSGDERILRDPAEKAQPVNTGVLFLLKSLDWSLSIQRFLELEGDPNFFTNQTMTHLTMHVNRALPLDKKRYILQRDDQCIYADRHAGNSLVLRHYVGPVRHKFWNKFAR